MDTCPVQCSMWTIVRKQSIAYRGRTVNTSRKKGCACDFCKELAGVPQGDHEGRPYMLRLFCSKCRGDPRGRPATCKNPTHPRKKCPMSNKPAILAEGL